MPLLFWLPPTALGVYAALARNQYAPAVSLLVLGLVAGWLALNWLGLWGNSELKRHYAQAFDQRYPNFEGYKAFVGFAPSGHYSVLDPHKDVGFLGLHSDYLVFVGEDGGMVVQRSEVREVGMAPSIHSVVGLGGWVSLKIHRNGADKTLFFEPRESDTLLVNNRSRKRMFSHLNNWFSLPVQK